MPRKTHIAWGRNVFPSPTARHGERLKKLDWFKCQQCGFRNPYSITWSNGPGDGNTNTSPVVRNAVTHLDTGLQWTVTGGCRMCGSYQATRKRPAKLPLAPTRIPLSRQQIMETAQ